MELGFVSWFFAFSSVVKETLDAHSRGGMSWGGEGSHTLIGAVVARLGLQIRCFLGTECFVGTLFMPTWTTRSFSRDKRIVATRDAYLHC